MRAGPPDRETALKWRLVSEYNDSSYETAITGMRQR
jgi:hypothetical protein